MILVALLVVGTVALALFALIDQALGPDPDLDGPRDPRGPRR